MKLRRLLAVVALAASTVAAGCNADSTGSGQASIAGTYNLQTVDGNKLPATLLSEPGYSFAVTSGSTTLRSDGTYTFQYGSTQTQGTVVTTDTYTQQGSYERNKNALTFTEFGASGSYTGSIAGSVLTITDGGYTLVFRK